MTTNPSLDPWRLLQNTFAAFQSMYVSLLILSSPGLILKVIYGFAAHGSAAPILFLELLSLVYIFAVLPLFKGAEVFYIHRHLTQRSIGVGEALQKMIPKLAQLSLAMFLLILLLIPGFLLLTTLGFCLEGLFSFLLLIAPGIYFCVRFGFALYAIALENRSAIGGISRSWELVKGRWWTVVIAILVIVLTIFIPIHLVSRAIGFTLGGEQGPPLAQLAGDVLAFLAGPITSTYLVLVFLRLRRLAENAPTDTPSLS